MAGFAPAGAADAVLRRFAPAIMLRRGT